MRQADINRVNRAKRLLKDATTILSSIKWENTNKDEDYLLKVAKEQMEYADFYLEDIISMQEK